MLASTLTAGTMIVAPVAAQETLPGQSGFTPALFVVGSFSNNEYRTATDPVSDSSLYTELELPFSFSGPRWTGAFSINPAWRKYRDLESLDQFETAVNGYVTGRLSQRTTLRIVVGAAHSPQITGLDGTDIITPRTNRLRARGLVSLRHRVNSAGDAFDIAGDFDTIDYLDGDFVGVQSYGLTAGYQKAIGQRLTFGLSGRALRLQYEDGSWVNSGTPYLGMTYRLGPRTDVDLRGGVSFSQGGGNPESELAPGNTMRPSFLGSLRHRGESWGMQIDASHEIASGVAIGEATQRTQLRAALSWQQGAWRLGIDGGFASNRLLRDGADAIILTPDGLVNTQASEVRTYSTCVDAGVRVANWISLVAAGRFATQQPVGVPAGLDVNVYRVSAGFAIHPSAPSVGASGARALDRYGRAGSLGAC